MMKKTRNLLCLFMLSAAVFGPGAAMAVDEPTTSSSTDTAPLTLDADQIQALQDQADGTSGGDDKSTFEKASDFVTDNAPWFIIGIIVLAAIVAGILIMRGRPRGGKTAKGTKGPKTPKASKSNKAKRKAGGAPAVAAAGTEPAQVPSASELRRRKRAAIQRSREEERLRRKAGIQNRKAARQGVPVPPPVPVDPATQVAMTSAGVPASGALDPVEAEKQAARDQETAAAAVARFGGAVPAPTSPSQTAPAAGVVTPYASEPAYAVPAEPVPVEPAPVYDSVPGADTSYEPAPAAAQPEPVAPEPAPIAPQVEPVTQVEPAFQPAPETAPEPDTSILHEEPGLEAPLNDAAVANAAQAFLAGGAAGAAGGLAAARGASQAQEPVAEDLDPVIAPEPGMAPEHALGDDPEPVAEVAPAPAAPQSAPVETDDRLRSKAAELRATQEPSPPEAPTADPSPTEISPGLAAVERRLSENSETRDRALREAEERLRRVEQRAEDAEKRAAFAERLAQLKVEESDRERRLNDVVSGIDRAEQRAQEAEARARAAEEAAAAALEQSDLKIPASAPTAPREPEPEASAPSDATPEPEAPATPPTPERKKLFSGSPAPSSGGSDAINLNSATFEELREAGLSVTQATRILAYRERFGGYNAVEDLEKVPGFPPDLIESLRNRVTI